MLHSFTGKNEKIVEQLPPGGEMKPPRLLSPLFLFIIVRQRGAIFGKAERRSACAAELPGPKIRT
jgi:hypothetical protein